MQTTSYFSALSKDIPIAELIERPNARAALSYLKAGYAVSASGRPDFTFVDFGDKPMLECLRGALVAVDMPLPGENGAVQRTWLNVMDRDNQFLPIEKMTLCDINNNRQRCLVKAIAMTLGLGMSVFLGFDGKGDEAAKALGVMPETDLATVDPMVSKLDSGAVYIQWNVAVAVCRITDPSFTWSVKEWDRMPFRKVLNGLFVDVETCYRGKSMTISLPVMDEAFNDLPADKVRTSDWNKTVMRALTKCIAFNTGYGLSVYSDESLDAGALDKAPEKAKRAPKNESEKVSEPAKAATATTESANQGGAEQAPAAEEAKTDVKDPVKESMPETKTADTPNATIDAKEATGSEAKAEVKTEAKTEAKPTDCVTRFKPVITKRRDVAGVPGVISLFNAVLISTKYKEAEKPTLFNLLLNSLAVEVTEAEIAEAVKEIGASKAMTHVAADAKDLVAGKLVAVYLGYACKVGDEALGKAPDVLAAAGLATDKADVLRLAAKGGVATEVCDLLKAL